MPVELTLDQMPHRLASGGAEFRVDYRPIGTVEPCERYLVVLTDVTTDVERERAEAERREAMAVFERVLADRAGFESFFEEASNLVEALTNGASSDPAVVKRLIHTLKGNAALYGLSSIAAMVHDLENFMPGPADLPRPSAA